MFEQKQFLALICWMGEWLSFIWCSNLSCMCELKLQMKTSLVLVSDFLSPRIGRKTKPGLGASIVMTKASLSKFEERFKDGFHLLSLSLSLISRILRDKSPMLHHFHISLTFDNTNAVRICWGEELIKREGEKRSHGLYLTGLTPIPPERSLCWMKGHLTILVILMDLSSLNWMLRISGLIFP